MTRKAAIRVTSSNKTSPEDEDAMKMLEQFAAMQGAEIIYNACGRCDDGVLQPNGIPSWQNRWTCNKCGKHVSK